jgi:hypothetical protein
MSFHRSALRSGCPYGAPPCSPKATADQDPSAALQREFNESASLESVREDSTGDIADEDAERSRFWRERRAPIADATLNFRMVHEAVEALKETGWSFESGQQAIPLYQELISKDLFKQAKKAPLSLLQLPLQSEWAAHPLLPLSLAESVRSVLPNWDRVTAAIEANPRVPPLKHALLFNSAVSPRSPRTRRTMGAAVAALDNGSSSTSRVVRSGGKASVALLSARAEDAAAMQLEGSGKVAASSRPQPHPPDDHPPQISISQFDFRLPLFPSTHLLCS